MCLKISLNFQVQFLLNFQALNFQVQFLKDQTTFAFVIVISTILIPYLEREVKKKHKIQLDYIIEAYRCQQDKSHELNF